MEAQTLAKLKENIRQYLKPHVKKIDADAFYPKEYMRSIGRSGLLHTGEGPIPPAALREEVGLVEATSAVCMTTGFNLWCHLAAVTYMRNSESSFLHHELRSSLENGTLLGGTGLSNPMKYYAGLEPLRLVAEPHADGYRITGTLPMVSNLGKEHWFGIVAEVTGEERRIMGAVPCTARGLELQERVGYLGLNGSSTYCCRFHRVEIPKAWIVAEDADAFIPLIRPLFVLYQIPLGLGVAESAIRSIERATARQNGCNRYLDVQAAELAEELTELRKQTHALCDIQNKPKHIRQFMAVRLASVRLALKSVQADMLHNGGAAYLQASGPSRRLREAYFFANLTPTVKHLEKQLQSGADQFN